MSSKEVEAARHGAESLGFSTIEADAVKKVVRENWECKLKEKGTDLDILNDHAAFMSRELSTIDYETLCMQNIAARAKHMSRGELLAYTKTIEALALGYKSRFGADFSGLLVAGVTLISKDAKTVRKHFDYFISHLSSGAVRCDKLIGKENGRLVSLDTELAKKNSGILRFFRKGDILRLRRSIRSRQIRIKRLEGRKRRYVSLAEQVKTKANPALPKKASSV